MKADPLIGITVLLETQRELQRRFGYDFEVMTEAEKADYAKECMLWLTSEVFETLQEIKGAKYWTHTRKFIDRPAFLGELSDVLHWVLNAYLAADATAEEIFELYHDKNKVNHVRQDTNYTGNEKCKDCGRAKDEPHLAD